MKKIYLLSFPIVIIAVVAIFNLIGFKQEYASATDPAGWLDGWNYRKKITISHTNVSSTLSNFPLLVKIINSTELSAAMADGNDIRFTSNNGMTLLSYETERWYVPGNGMVTADFWVKVPVISNTVDTDIYIYYGRQGAFDGDNAIDATYVWGAGYKGVWHLGNPYNFPFDSTKNQNHGTPPGVNGATGKINVGGDFASNSISVNNNINVSNFTISTWFKENGGTGFRTLIAKESSNNNRNFWLGFSNGDPSYGDVGAITLLYSVGGVADAGLASTTLTYTDNAWHLAEATYDGENIKIYVDGVLETTKAGGIPDIQTHATTFGNDAPDNDAYTGLMDEIRISDIARPADWIKFEYENQNSATNELTIADQENTASSYVGEYWNLQAGCSPAPVFPTTTPVYNHTDTTLNFNWVSGSPNEVINTDCFVGRWTKTENFAAGQYLFTLGSDDGSRLYVDDALILNRWVDQQYMEISGSANLTAGDHTIRVEYYENEGGARVALNYSKLSPIYWYNDGVNNDWDTLTGNWWSDSGHNNQALELPGYFDSVTTLGSQGPEVNLHTWVAPGSIDATATGISFASTGYGDSIPLDITGSTTIKGSNYLVSPYKIIGHATFFNNSINNGGTIIGDATFHNNAYNYDGNITGNAIFYDNGENAFGGIVAGSALFYDNSVNRGTVSSSATFYNNSYVYYGTVNGNAIFNDNSYVYIGTFLGNATFNTSYYSSSIPVVGLFTFDNGFWNATVNGTVFGSDSAPITNYIFNTGTFNSARINGNTTFNNDAYNNQQIYGDVLFNGTGYNNNSIFGNVIFNSSSFNNSDVNGTSTFNNDSRNKSVVVGNAIFNDSSFNDSENNATVTLNAIFNNTSHNNGTVNGNATFACGTANYGIVNGTITNETCSLVGAYESADTIVTPTSPGSAANYVYSFATDTKYFTTSLSQIEDGFDSQVYKFNPTMTGITIPKFTAQWTGHGDTNDKPTSLSIWNNTLLSWDLLQTTTTCSEDCELNGTKSGTKYRDNNGFVWFLAKAINYFNPPVIADVTANSGLLPIQWQTDQPGTSLVAYDTVSHDGESWDTYQFHVTSTALVSSHTVVLSSLNNGTPYFYRVRSANASGDYSIDNTEYSFTFTQAQSCPFLFTYNGSDFQFVVDVSTPGNLAGGISRDLWKTNPFYKDPISTYANPKFDVKIPTGGLVPRNINGESYYDIKITSELNEVDYLDSTSLEVVDHSVDVNVFPDYRNNGIIHSIRKDAQAPISVKDQNNVSVSDEISSVDNIYWHSDKTATPSYLTIKLVDGPSTPNNLKLAIKRVKEGSASGVGGAGDKLQYKNASGNFVDVPNKYNIFTVTRDGASHSAKNPANIYGDADVKIIDLSGLTIKDNEIRLITTSDVKQWDIDWLAVDTSADEEIKTTNLTPYYADLNSRGVSKQIFMNPSDPTMKVTMPDFNQIAKTFGAGTPLTGMATKYGDVKTLLSTADNKFVIMVQGDQLSLKYSIPSITANTERDFIYHTWDYHKAYNNATGDTITPLPFNEMTRYPYSSEESYPNSAEYQIYQNTYNTRKIEWTNINTITNIHHSINTDAITLSTQEADTETSTTTVPIRSSGGGSSSPAPVGVGNGEVDVTIPMGQTGNIGTISTAGVNYLSYIGSNAGFNTPVSHDNTIENHHLIINNLDLSINFIEFTIQSTPQKVKLKIGESAQIDLDGDKIKDIEVKFVNVWINRAELTVRSLLGVKKVSAQTIKTMSDVKKYIFKKNLSSGMINNDVKELQKWLNANGYIIAKSGAGSPGKETAKFGAATRNALVRFQKANKISPAIGYFGLLTRNLINNR